MRYSVFESIVGDSKRAPVNVEEGAKQSVVYSTTYTALPQG